MTGKSILLLEITPEFLQEIVQEAVQKGFSHSQKEHLRELNNEELLTREEAAELLKINLSTLWHWTKKGKVQTYGIAGRVYYKRGELMNALIPIKQKGGKE